MSNFTRRELLAASTGAAALGAAAFQANPVEVAPGVYFRAGDLARGQSNSGFIVCPEWVIAIEAPTPEASAAMQAEIAAVTSKPVRYVVLTHGHGDHLNGLEAFTSKGAMVVCAEALRRQLEAKNAPGQFVGISERLTLRAGGRNIELATYGRAHSPSDLFVSLPGEGVLFSGDAVLNMPAMFMGECDVVNWIRTLRRLEKGGSRVVCPGHGPSGGAELIERMADHLTALRDEVGYQICQGRTFEAALGQVKAPEQARYARDAKHFEAQLKAVYAQLTAAPAAPASAAVPHALVLIGDYYHRPAWSRPPLEAVFEKIGMPATFIYDVTKLNAASLRGYRLLVILRDGMNRPEVGGKPVWWMTAEQEKAVVEFVERGGGYLALHNATALKEKPAQPGPYRDMLGSSYNGHGPADEKFEVRVVDAGHQITRGVSGYAAVDEHHWPVIHASDIHVLTRTSGNHVNGYTRTHGAGRVCYLATGHHRAMLELPSMQQLMANAALWCIAAPRWD
jgi:cyclase